MYISTFSLSLSLSFFFFSWSVDSHGTNWSSGSSSYVSHKKKKEEKRKKGEFFFLKRDRMRVCALGIELSSDGGFGSARRRGQFQGIGEHRSRRHRGTLRRSRRSSDEDPPRGGGGNLGHFRHGHVFGLVCFSLFARHTINFGWRSAFLSPPPVPFLSPFCLARSSRLSFAGDRDG